MAILNKKLFVADGGHLLTFDLSQIPSAKDEISPRAINCAVCGFKAGSSPAQPVVPGTAAVASWGKSLVAIDPRSHRISIWRDLSKPGATKPDVTLQFGTPELPDPISVAIDMKRLFVGDATLHAVLVWNTLPARDNQPPDAQLGSYASQGPLAAADTLGRPEALASDGNSLFVADSQAHRILVFSPADSHLHPEAVLNSATLLPGAFAGGTLISISGNALSETTAVATEDGSEPLPGKLAGVEAIFNGVPLSLISVSPQEVRAQLPYYASGEASSASLYIRTEHADRTVSTTDAVAIALAPASPGLFAFAGDEPRPAMAFRSSAPISSEQPALAGDTIRLWATGLHVTGDSVPNAGMPFHSGEVTVTPVAALVDGDPAEVTDVDLPASSIGIYEVLVRLPEAHTYRDGIAHLTLIEDGVSSNAVAVSVSR
jgi:uncharacterized protein (TIGR03437 family)